MPRPRGSGGRTPRAPVRTGRLRGTRRATRGGGTLSQQRTKDTQARLDQRAQKSSKPLAAREAKRTPSPVGATARPAPHRQAHAAAGHDRGRAQVSWRPDDAAAAAGQGRQQRHEAEFGHRRSAARTNGQEGAGARGHEPAAGGATPRAAASGDPCLGTQPGGEPRLGTQAGGGGGGPRHRGRRSAKP